MSKQKIEISSNNFCGCFGETILWNLSRSRWILHIHIFITVHVNWKVGKKKSKKKIAEERIFFNSIVCSCRTDYYYPIRVWLRQAVRYSCALNFVHWASDRNIEYVWLYFFSFSFVSLILFLSFCAPNAKSYFFVILRRLCVCVNVSCLLVTCICVIIKINKFSTVHNYNFIPFDRFGRKICNFLQKSLFSLIDQLRGSRSHQIKTLYSTLCVCEWTWLHEPSI